MTPVFCACCADCPELAGMSGRRMDSVCTRTPGMSVREFFGPGG